MKPLDDKKIVEQNSILEKELETERAEWKNKVLELIKMMDSAVNEAEEADVASSVS